MTDTIARDIHQERADLVRLLMEARGMLAGATVYIDFAIQTWKQQGIADTNLQGVAEIKNRVENFLNAGLFGDKGGK